MFCSAMRVCIVHQKGATEGGKFRVQTLALLQARRGTLTPVALFNRLLLPFFKPEHALVSLVQNDQNRISQGAIACAQGEARDSLVQIRIDLCNQLVKIHIWPGHGKTGMLDQISENCGIFAPEGPP
jgi:hypothetical protein